MAEKAERSARVEAELARRGVPREVARALARELTELFAALGPAAGDAVTAAASAVRGAAPDAGAPTRSDLDEIHRLMGAFVGELKKLDEALQILAAMLTRMRDKSASPPDRVLH
jgi:hypothetical protein